MHQRHLPQFAKLGCPKTKDRIPTLRCREATSIAANRGPVRYVRQCLLSVRVQERVQESKRGFPFRQQNIVHAGNDGCENRGGG